MLQKAWPEFAAPYAEGIHTGNNDYAARIAVYDINLRDTHPFLDADESAATRACNFDSRLPHSSASPSGALADLRLAI